MAQKQLSRKQRERLQHRQEILDTALKLFSERGFHNVSMQQVAEASEFAVGTLYNFFESKESLFEELTNRCGDKMIGALMAILDAPGTEVERLTSFFRNSPILLEEHSEFIRLYVSELGMRGAKLSKRPEKDNFDAVLYTRLQQLLESGMRKGVFRRVDPAIATKAISSTIETLAFEISGRFDKAEAEEIFSKVELLFIGGLLLPEDKG